MAVGGHFVDGDIALRAKAKTDLPRPRPSTFSMPAKTLHARPTTTGNRRPQRASGSAEHPRPGGLIPPEYPSGVLRGALRRLDA